jgi:hypothetical protein
MTSLQLAKKARELVLSNKPARLYKSIMRCVPNGALNRFCSAVFKPSEHGRWLAKFSCFSCCFREIPNSTF